MIYLLTGEYPPHSGGVAGHTALLAKALAARGEEVHVWTGGAPSADDEHASNDGFSIHRVGGGFGFPGLLGLNREWNRRPAPRLVFLQWTPHSFGMRSLNLLFALWVWKRGRLHRNRIELMVHEPFLAFGKHGFRRNAAAAVHRAMIALLLDAASHVRVTIPAWAESLRPWAFRRKHSFEWLAVPSNIPLSTSLAAVVRARSGFTPNGTPLVGHFGAFRDDVAGLLRPALAQLLCRRSVRVVLVGRGSRAFAAEFARAHPHLGAHLSATGEIDAEDIAAVLSACDILLQPYPDGISTRRGTAMAALALGVPLVSNLGRLSEPQWNTSHAVCLTGGPGAAEMVRAVLQLLDDSGRRRALSANAHALYREQFDIEYTLRSLLRNRADGERKARAARA